MSKLQNMRLVEIHRFRAVSSGIRPLEEIFFVENSFSQWVDAHSQLMKKHIFEPQDSFGLGMMLALGNVVVRDIGYLYAVVTTGWMYLTPLFYPLESLPDALQHMIINYNPTFFFIKQGRDIFLYHQ